MLKTVLKLSVVATIALCITSCGGNSKKASNKLNDSDFEKLELVGQNIKSVDGGEAVVANMIPSNAILALRVNPEQLWDKAFGSIDSRNIYAYDNMMGALYESLPLLREPETIGLDLEKPVVLSVSTDIKSIEPFSGVLEACVVASLDDRDNLIKQIDVLVETLKKENEVEITKTDFGGKYTHYMLYADEEGAFDLGVFPSAAVLRVTYAPSATFENMETTLAKLFIDGTSADTEGLKKFYGSQSDAALWVDAEKFMNTIMSLGEKYSEDAYNQLLPLLPMYEGASMVSELNFNDGNTTLEFGIYGSDKLKEQALKYNTPASNKYFKYLPASSAFVLNVAIKNFPGLVEELSQTNEEFAEIFESLEPLGFDKEFYEGFPGVITCAVDGHSLGSSEDPHIVLFMECDRNVWETLESYIYEVADNVDYDLYSIDNQYYIGYVDGAIMMMDASTRYRMEYGYVDSFDTTDLAWEIRKGGMALNLEALPYYVLDQEEFRLSGYDILEFVSSVVVTTSPDFMSATIKVNMGDPYQNFLSKIVNFALESIAYDMY